MLQSTSMLGQNTCTLLAWRLKHLRSASTWKLHHDTNKTNSTEIWNSMSPPKKYEQGEFVFTTIESSSPLHHSRTRIKRLKRRRVTYQIFESYTLHWGWRRAFWICLLFRFFQVIFTLLLLVWIVLLLSFPFFSPISFLLFLWIMWLLLWVECVMGVWICGLRLLKIECCCRWRRSEAECESLFAECRMNQQLNLCEESIPLYRIRWVGL